jgi:hypothetical protein
MVRGPAPEALRVTAIVTRALEDLGVAHAVVGSLASSLHGIPRSTNDVDIVAALGPQHAQPLTAVLQDAFYVDEDMIRDAVARRAEFNVIHLGTMFKVDIFIPASDPVSRAQIGRATVITVDADPALTLRVASAEDTVVQKLLWYRGGGEASERQWLDTLGVLSVQGDDLDLDYLKQSTDAVGVRDLLDRALAEAVASAP